jgi:hypothetical protein
LGGGALPEGKKFCTTIIQSTEVNHGPHLKSSINLDRKVTESSQSPYSTYVFEQNITAAQNYQWVDVPVSLGIGYEIKPKNMGRFYLQPVFRSNILTQLVFIPKALFGRRSPEPEIPTSVNTFGVELGYFLK